MFTVFCVFHSRFTVRICELCAGITGAEKLWHRNLGTNKVSYVYLKADLPPRKCH